MNKVYEITHGPFKGHIGLLKSMLSERCYWLKLGKNTHLLVSIKHLKLSD